MRRTSSRTGISNLTIFKKLKAPRTSYVSEREEGWAEGKGEEEIHRRRWVMSWTLPGAMLQGRALVVGTRWASRTLPAERIIARTLSGGSE